MQCSLSSAQCTAASYFGLDTKKTFPEVNTHTHSPLKRLLGPVVFFFSKIKAHPHKIYQTRLRDETAGEKFIYSVLEIDVSRLSLKIMSRNSDIYDLDIRKF